MAEPVTISDLMLKLQTEKKAGFELQHKRHEDWTDNFELYRNKVKTNRLTQRQAVNIPLMKETIKRLLSSIDDPPNAEWHEIGGDDYKDLVMDEIWNEHHRLNKLEIIDIIDKKNVLLYGLSAKKLNINEKGVECSVLDPYDLFIDPLTNPWDLNSARFLIHNNIFRSVRDILADARYTDKGKDDLKVWLNSPSGLMQTQEARQQWEEKMQRMRAMGVQDSDFPYFAGGDTLVNLTEHNTLVWNGKKFEKRVIIYANDNIELMNKSLDELLGVDFWPYVVWSEDLETQDVYPDSVADLIRTPNKVLNVWFSQLIENRTLKNFQMHWFMPAQGYTPQTYTPGPGMMLPAPPGDDIKKTIMPVEVSGLDDTLEAINIITQIVERGSGVTALQKGQAEQGRQTLGEVEILLGQATERVTSMAKFYRLAWQEYAEKWYGLMEANAPKILKLSKQGLSGKLYEKKIMAGDWKSQFGYKVMIKSSSEQENDNVKGIQKWQFILNQFPNNEALRKIGQKRMLEIVDLTPEELKQVEESETKQLKVNPEVQESKGQDEELAQGIEQSLTELESLRV